MSNTVNSEIAPSSLTCMFTFLDCAKIGLTIFFRIGLIKDFLSPVTKALKVGHVNRTVVFMLTIKLSSLNDQFFGAVKLNVYFVDKK